MKLFKSLLLMSLLVFGGIVLPLHAAGGTLVAVEEEEEVKEQEIEPESVYERPSLYNRKAWLQFLEKKQEGSKRTQFLPVFLDDDEVNPRSQGVIITEELFYAIRDKAGPIITSISLLYNLMDGSFTQKEPQVAAEFKKIFGDGKDWFLRAINNDLVIIIPKSYLEAQNMSLSDVGLLVKSIFAAQDVPFLKEYSQSIKKVSSGESFVDALLNNKIFDNNNQESEWVIYIVGHGDYGKHIASIPLHRFAQMLDFLNKKVNMALLVYDACFSAGLNGELVYKELTPIGAKCAKEYSFPIVTQAIGDITTSRAVGEELYHERFIRNFRELLGRDNRGYEEALNRFKENRGPWEPLDISHEELTDLMRNYRDAYREVLASIMPYLGRFGRKDTKGINQKLKGNIPQIRFPYTAAWFPVVADQNIIIRISEVMAMSRIASLSIGKGDSYESLKAVLFDTDYIPFDLVIEKLVYPHFIITVPGDTAIYVQKMENRHYHDFQRFVVFMGIDYVKQSTEEGNKVMFIKELVLREIQGTDIVSILHKDVVIDFAGKTAYYTDEHNKHYKMYMKQGECSVRAGEIEFGEYQGDYRLLYSDPLVTNKSIREKVLKRQAMQQIEQALVKCIESKREA